jgi:hypothetical protein
LEKSWEFKEVKIDKFTGQSNNEENNARRECASETHRKDAFLKSVAEN